MSLGALGQGPQEGTSIVVKTRVTVCDVTCKNYFNKWCVVDVTSSHLLGVTTSIND